MRDHDAVDVLYVVSASGFADNSKLQSVCLPLANACREESPWSLLVGRALPLRLLWWHLRGGDRSELPYNGGGERNLTVGFGVRERGSMRTASNSGAREVSPRLESPSVGGIGVATEPDASADSRRTGGVTDSVSSACEVGLPSRRSRVLHSSSPSSKETPGRLARCGADRCRGLPRRSSGVSSFLDAGRNPEAFVGGTEDTEEQAAVVLRETCDKCEGLSRLAPRRLISRLVIDAGVNLEGIVWPVGVVRLEIGEVVMFTRELLEMEREASASSCGSDARTCHRGSQAASVPSVAPGESGADFFRGDCFARALCKITFPRELKHLELLGLFNKSVVGVDWPPSLEVLVLGDFFNKSLKGVVFPRGLKSLTLGSAFNKTLEDISWPPLLTHLQLGQAFNMDISDVRWPSALGEIHFGDRFQQPIEGVKWPEGLQTLTFGHIFQQPVERVVWPSGLRELKFGAYYNCSIDKVGWPDGLRSLDLGRCFNRPVERTTWPKGLELLTFGDLFDQPIEAAKWPDGLRVLRFGSHFDQEIEKVTWPSSLEHLAFRQHFDREIERVRFPPGLRTLELGNCFDKPIAGVEWPRGLERLVFGYFFNQPVEEVRWPASLRHLTFSGIFNQPLGNVRWPPKLESIEVGQGFSGDLKGVEWPKSLRHMTIRYARPRSTVPSCLPPPGFSQRRGTAEVGAPLTEDNLVLPSCLESSVCHVFERLTVTLKNCP